MNHLNSFSETRMNPQQENCSPNDLFSCYFMNANTKKQRICLTPLDNTTTFPISPIQPKQSQTKAQNRVSANVADGTWDGASRQKNTGGFTCKPVALGDITNTRQSIATNDKHKRTTPICLKNSNDGGENRNEISAVSSNKKSEIGNLQRFKQFKRQGLDEERGSSCNAQRKSPSNNGVMNNDNALKNKTLRNETASETVIPDKERKMDSSWRRAEKSNNCDHLWNENKEWTKEKTGCDNTKNGRHTEQELLNKMESLQVLPTRMVPCANWHQFSVCFEGAECPNSHKIHCKDFRRHVTNYKCKPCVDPALGKQCIYGDNCNFVHPGEEIRRPMPIEYVDKQYYTLLLRDCPTSRFPFGIYL